MADLKSLGANLFMLAQHENFIAMEWIPAWMDQLKPDAKALLADLDEIGFTTQFSATDGNYVTTVAILDAAFATRAIVMIDQAGNFTTAFVGGAIDAGVAAAAASVEQMEETDEDRADEEAFLAKMAAVGVKIQE